MYWISNFWRANFLPRGSSSSCERARKYSSFFITVDSSAKHIFFEPRSFLPRSYRTPLGGSVLLPRSAIVSRPVFEAVEPEMPLPLKFNNTRSIFARRVSDAPRKSLQLSSSSLPSFSFSSFSSILLPLLQFALDFRTKTILVLHFSSAWFLWHLIHPYAGISCLKVGSRICFLQNSVTRSCCAKERNINCVTFLSPDRRRLRKSYSYLQIERRDIKTNEVEKECDRRHSRSFERFERGPLMRLPCLHLILLPAFSS